MSLAWCQINQIDVNFQLQKILEIFDKNSADKIWFKQDKGMGKSTDSCQLGLTSAHSLHSLCIETRKIVELVAAVKMSKCS